MVDGLLCAFHPVADLILVASQALDLEEHSIDLAIHCHLAITKAACVQCMSVDVPRWPQAACCQEQGILHAELFQSYTCSQTNCSLCPQQPLCGWASEGPMTKSILWVICPSFLVSSSACLVSRGRSSVGSSNVGQGEAHGRQCQCWHGIYTTFDDMRHGFQDLQPSSVFLLLRHHCAHRSPPS